MIQVHGCYPEGNPGDKEDKRERIGEEVGKGIKVETAGNGST